MFKILNAKSELLDIAETVNLAYGFTLTNTKTKLVRHVVYAGAMIKNVERMDGFQFAAAVAKIDAEAEAENIKPVCIVNDPDFTGMYPNSVKVEGVKYQLSLIEYDPKNWGVKRSGVAYYVNLGGAFFSATPTPAPAPAAPTPTPAPAPAAPTPTPAAPVAAAPVAAAPVAAAPVAAAPVAAAPVAAAPVAAAPAPAKTHNFSVLQKFKTVSFKQVVETACGDKSGTIEALELTFAEAVAGFIKSNNWDKFDPVHAFALQHRGRGVVIADAMLKARRCVPMGYVSQIEGVKFHMQTPEEIAGWDVLLNTALDQFSESLTALFPVKIEKTKAERDAAKQLTATKKEVEFKEKVKAENLIPADSVRTLNDAQIVNAARDLIEAGNFNDVAALESLIQAARNRVNQLFADNENRAATLKARELSDSEKLENKKQSLLSELSDKLETCGHSIEAIKVALRDVSELRALPLFKTVAKVDLLSNYDKLTDNQASAVTHLVSQHGLSVAGLQDFAVSYNAILALESEFIG